MKKSKKPKNSDLVWTLKIAGLKVQALAELISNQSDVCHPLNKQDLDWAIGLIFTSIGKEVEDVSRIIEEKQIRKAMAKNKRR